MSALGVDAAMGFMGMEVHSIVYAWDAYTKEGALTVKINPGV